MLYKPLPKWLVFLCLRHWCWEHQFWEWPGPLPKVMWPSLGTRCSTEEMGLLPGAVKQPSQARLLLPLLFWLDWMLALNTTLEWEQSLLPEMESGVLSRQRELLIVSLYASSTVIMYMVHFPFFGNNSGIPFLSTCSAVATPLPLHGSCTHCAYVAML